MKRVLSLVLALVMVFGTIMPAFAEETVAVKTSGEMLQAYGLIDGTDKGLEEDQPLTRSQMAKILAKLNGKADVAATYAFPSSFTDVPADKWYAGYVAYAEAQGWMDGDAKGGTFRPEDNLKVQEINKLMVEALGYTVAYADVNAKAEELKIAVVAADKTLVLRGEIFAAMVTTLDVPKKDETDTLGTSLALVGYTSPTPAIPETLEVVTVVTDNLKTIVVEFNQELLAKSVNTTNFKVTGLTVSKALLGEDKKTVTLDMSSEIPQSKEIELVITKVKDATEAKTIADYKTKFVVNDVTVPVVESISVIDAKHVMIQASEPMNFAYAAFTVLPGIKIDGTAVIGKVVADNQMNTYTIEFNSVKKEGSYKMTIEGLKDYAKLAAVKKDFTFDVAKDDKAPVAVSAKAASVTVVEVTFDEPLATIGTITINGKATTETYKANSNQKVVLATLKVEDKLTLGATVEVNVKYKGQKDVVGNEVKTETALTFKVTDDTTMPTATVEVKAGNKMVFTFSKAMDITLGKVNVLDKDKKVMKEVNVSGLGTWNADKTVLTVVASSLSTSTFNLATMNPTEAYMQLKDMKDSTVRANLLATVDLSVTLLDTMTPKVAGNYTTAVNTTTGTDPQNDDTVTFFFTEAMDEDTLKNLSNYLEGSTALSTKPGVSVKSVATDMKSITITIPSAGVGSYNPTFTIVALKDLAGNMSDYNNAITKGLPGFTTITKVEPKSTTQIAVTFPIKVKSIDPAAIAVVLHTGGDAVTTVSSVASIVDQVVTLNLVDAIKTEGTLYDVKVVSESLIKSVYDSDFDPAGDANTYVRQMDNTIAPTVSSFEDGAWNGALATPAVAAADNQAVLTFSEPITVANLTTLEDSLTVKVGTLYLAADQYAVTLADNRLTITVDPIASLTNKDDYALEVKLNAPTTQLVDAAGNKVAVFTKSITDFKYDKGAVTLTVDVANTKAYDAVVDGKVEKIDVAFTSTNAISLNTAVTTAAEAKALLTAVTVNNGVTDVDVKPFITGATITGKVISFTLTGAPVGTGDLKVTVAANAVKDDVSGQSNAAIAVTTGTDAVAPVVVDWNISINTASPLNFGEITDQVTLTYSEDVDITLTADSTKTEIDAEFVFTDSDTTAELAAGTTMTHAGTGTNVITLTVKGSDFTTPIQLADSPLLETKAGTKIKAGTINQAAQTGLAY